MISDKHDSWFELAEVYALEALDGNERSQFEAHLSSGCDLCQKHLEEIREALTLVSKSLAPVAPPAHVKKNLMNQIAEEATPLGRAKPRLSWIRWGAGACALALAMIVIPLGWNLNQAQQELKELRGMIADFETLKAEKEDILRLISRPGTRMIRLTGLDPSPSATAILIWDFSRREGYLLTHGLPQVPGDKIYEFWVLENNQPVPAGVFTVDPTGRALFRLPPLPETKIFDKFAVTLEPAGGVSQPTGPMYLIGSF